MPIESKLYSTNFNDLGIILFRRQCFICHQKYFLICERDTFKKSIAPKFKEKGSSSNEIMLHAIYAIFSKLDIKVTKIEHSAFFLGHPV